MWVFFCIEALLCFKSVVLGRLNRSAEGHGMRSAVVSAVGELAAMLSVSSM